MLILRTLVLTGSVLIAASAALERRSIVQPANALKNSEVEGSGKPEFGSPVGPDQEENRPFQGSGYPSDDEDGEEITSQSGVVEGSGAPAWSAAIPALTTTTTTVAPNKGSSDQVDHVVDEEHVLQEPSSHEIFPSQLTTEQPRFIVPQPPTLPATTVSTATTTTSTSTRPSTTRRPQPPPPKHDSPAQPPSEEAKPFYAWLKPGVFAAIVGSFIVGLLATVFIIVFIVYRMRKKDEGSYALDEPKTRPYAGYAYTKASTKEFYA